MADTNFRERLRRGDRLVGTFIKSPTACVPEILGLAGLDFAVADSEHGAIGLGVLDQLVPSARLGNLPLLTRVPSNDLVTIGRMLDVGITGVVVPHVTNADEAERCLDAVKFGRRRGFSPSPRAGRYGTEDHITYRRRADADSVTIVQIEDASALPNLEAIAALDEIDALFIGPADLSLSMGYESPLAAEVQAAIQRVAQAGERHGRRVMIAIGDPKQARQMQRFGISCFVCGSDQALLLSAARSLKSDITTI